MEIMEYTYHCIKCGVEYKSDDPDGDYYCSSCLLEKKAIAKRIDAKIARLPKKEVKSDLQKYDEIQKSQKTPFPRAKDLGIPL